MDNANVSGAAPNGAPEDFIDFKLYRYTPSLPAAITATIIFGILSILHSWRMVRARAWYFTAFTVGGIFQTIGYIGRIISHYDKESLPGYIVQAILILVAPALFAASIYMILGRLIRSVRAERLSVVPVAWVTKIFVCGDVVSFSLQAAGGGIQASGTIEAYNRGEKIIVAGLCTQIVIFGFFVVTSVFFHRRLSDHPTPRASQNVIPWERGLWVLYVVSVIILVRSVFRVIEYLQGNDGYLISHEAFLYIFDSILMATVMVVFLLYYVDYLDIKPTDEGCREQIDSRNSMLEDLSY